MSKYYDETITLDFELPEYLKETIDNLIKERMNNSLHADFYEEDLISDCNRVYNDGIITLEQVKLIREKYL